MSSPSIRVRRSKACESCRARRIKCTGNTPCQECSRLGLNDTCHIREKARPNRTSNRHTSATTASRFMSSGTPRVSRPKDAMSTGQSSVPDFLGMFLAGPPSSTVEPSSGSCSGLSQEIALPVDPPGAPTGAGVALSFYDRLSKELHTLQRMRGGIPVEGPPSVPDPCGLDTYLTMSLPTDQSLVALEESMMHIVCSKDDRRKEHFSWVDPTYVVRLYGRYRAVPDSVPSEEMAVLYATFCPTRLIQLTRETSSPGSFQFSSTFTPREDLTYYRLANEAIKRSRPSVYVLWALYCLLPYTFALGSPVDTRGLVGLMGVHIRALGLHRAMTAALYDESQLVIEMFSTFFYMDTLTAGLTDMTPTISLGDLDQTLFVPPAGRKQILHEATLEEARLLQDLLYLRSETSTPEYLGKAYHKWQSQLQLIRRECGTRLESRQLPYADLRFNWLILLVATPIALDNDEFQSTSMVCRSVSQIVFGYKELDLQNRYHPSWPQLRVCTALAWLIAVFALKGSFHPYETDQLIVILRDLLAKHLSSTPAAGEVIRLLETITEHLGTSRKHPEEPQMPEYPTEWWNLDLGAGLFG